jgi:hypothetical protein
MGEIKMKMPKISMGKSRLKEPTLSFGSYGSRTIHEPKISIGGYGSMKEPKGMSMSSMGMFKEPKGMSLGGMSKGSSSGMDMFGSSKPERKSRVHAKKGRKKVIHISQLFSGKKKSRSHTHKGRKRVIHISDLWKHKKKTSVGKTQRKTIPKREDGKIATLIKYLKQPVHYYKVYSQRDSEKKRGEKPSFHYSKVHGTLKNKQTWNDEGIKGYTENKEVSKEEYDNRKKTIFEQQDE